ncbi:MAG: helix-hairpin-helix domain-containing protein [Phascolarctobacterium sp.]|nr:helix-hairpin-helix domain-containing protein [Phascolarctobacterium sp.]MBR6511424.1 helix-hairpin-helix domain-containing protein [Phascolarctobacterium sp.]
MDNYKQKIFLLCILLLGCVLTSIGVEFFTKADEPLQIPQPMFVEQHILPNEREISNLQESVSRNKRALNTNNELSKMERAYEKTDNEKQELAFPININTANEKELDALPGIGPAIARRIVEYRSSQPFTKIEDIMQVKGIGEKKFAKIKELITVE